MYSEDDWADAYSIHFDSGSWYRIPVKEGVEPIQDYSFEQFMQWLEYDAINDRYRRIRDGNL